MTGEEKIAEKMHEKILEKWIINTADELYFDQLDDYIDLPIFITELDCAIAGISSFTDKKYRSVSVGFFNKFVPKDQELAEDEQEPVYVAVVSYFKNGVQTVYIVHCDGMDIDFESFERHAVKFDRQLDQPDNYGEFSSIVKDGHVRYFDRYTFYQLHSDIPVVKQIKLNTSFEEFLAANTTTNEPVAVAKLGSQTLSKVFKIRIKDTEKDYLAAVPTNEDAAEEHTDPIKLFDASLDPELVAYKAAR